MVPVFNVFLILWVHDRLQAMYGVRTYTYVRWKITLDGKFSNYIPDILLFLHVEPTSKLFFVIYTLF